VGSRIPANNEIVWKAVKCGLAGWLARCHSPAASISVFIALNIGEIRTGQPLAIEDSVPRHHPSFPHFHLAKDLIEIVASQHLFQVRFDFKTARREFHGTNRKPLLLYQYIRQVT